MGGGLTGTTAFCQNLGMPERPKETYPKAQMARITPQLQAEIQQLFRVSSHGPNEWNQRRFQKEFR
jgi:hypothetical protein